jgi:hypothetical protein
VLVVRGEVVKAGIHRHFERAVVVLRVIMEGIYEWCTNRMQITVR